MTEQATLTRCPACQTVFAVEAEDLARAGGRVRCGDCLQVFDARAHAIDAGDGASAEDARAAAGDDVATPPETEAQADVADHDEAADAADDAGGAAVDEPDDVDDEQFTITNWFIVDEPSASGGDGAAVTGDDDRDDSGAFRFGDDTPPETLQAELEALVGDEVTPDAGGGDAPDADTPPIAANAVAGGHGDTPPDTPLDDDWDELLGELDEEIGAQLDAVPDEPAPADEAPEPTPPGPADTDDAPEPTPSGAAVFDEADDTADALSLVDTGAALDADGAPLDFELVDSDSAGSETSLDLDLTRATPATDGDIVTPPDDADAPHGDGDTSGDGRPTAPPEAADGAPPADDDGDRADDDSFDDDAVDDFMAALRLLDEAPADGEDAAAAGDDDAGETETGDADEPGAPADADAGARRDDHGSDSDDAGADQRRAAVGEDTISAMASGARGEVIVLGEDAEAVARDTGTAGAAVVDDDPSFAESMIVSPDLAPRRPRRTGLWTALSLLAAVALLLQSIHAWRDTLITQPYWQDALPRIYGAFGVELLPGWDIRQWCVERSGALASDTALDVESTFSNRGDRPLPLPRMKVRIVDAYSDTLAAAIIAPRDYLAGTLPDRIEPGQRVTAVARLDYNEPRLDGYEISLCYPGPNGTLRCGSGCPDDD